MTGKLASLLVALLVAIAALLLVSCAPTPVPAPTPVLKPKEAPAATSVPKAAEKKPQPGGAFILATHNDYNEYNPGVARETGLSTNQLGAVYSSLLLPENKPTLGATYVPHLVESWTQPDPTTYILKLRQGIKWQNLPPVNGREFVAEDVKFSLNWYVQDDPKYLHKPKLDAIKSMETPDKYTVKITTKEPLAPFLSNLAHMNILMVAKEAAEADKDGLNKFVVGTGPFILKERNPKTSYTFVKNPDYFLKGYPYLDEYKVLIMPDNAARFAALRAGRIHDAGYFLTAEDVKILKEQHKDIMVEESVTPSPPAIVFNVSKAPFDDVRVRRAIFLATDREAIAKALWFDAVKPTYFIPWGYQDFALPNAEILKKPGVRSPKDQDIAEAKKLMQEAGHGGGLKVKIMAVVSGRGVDHATMLRDQLKAIGMDIEVEPTDTSKANDREIAGDFLWKSHYTGGGKGEVDNYLVAFSSGGSKASSRYSNPELDRLLALQRATMKLEERKKIIQGQIIPVLERDVPGFELFTPVVWRAWPKRFQGLSAEPGYGELARYIYQVWEER